MQTKASFDVIVIGTGSAGFSAIEAAVQAGARVCAIEQHLLGGECPRYACIPSKALLKAAGVYRTAKHAREMGIQIGSLGIDFKKIMEHRARAVETITGTGTQGKRYTDILTSLGVEVKFGKAMFLDEHMIDVGGERLFGKTFVIASGAVDAIPPIEGIDAIPYKTWKNALMQDRQPKSMVVIGGGPVGCELATFYASIGTRVVLLQRADQLLTREEPDLAVLVQESLTRLGVDVRLNVVIDSVVDSRGGVFGVRIQTPTGLEMIAVDQIVMATGKRGDAASLGCAQARVAVDALGFIRINKEFRTSVPHIFAAGDCTGGMQFTHVAHRSGSVAGLNAAFVAKRKRGPMAVLDTRVVPRVTFTDPEVASVGMTTAQAKKMYKQILVGQGSMATLGRAVTDQTRYGFLKLIVHPKTRKILGGHMMGACAGEVIHEVALAIFLHATIDKLSEMIHAFPTYSEIVSVAASRLTRV